MSAPAARPRLASKARLRFDRHSGKHMLVYPEKGLALNATAAAVVELCTGEHSPAEIVERMVARHPDAPRAQIERDVLAFLDELARRRLLGDAP